MFIPGRPFPRSSSVSARCSSLFRSNHLLENIALRRSAYGVWMSGDISVPVGLRR
jgi:hypothetical protein